jgi:hypothetical protein
MICLIVQSRSTSLIFENLCVLLIVPNGLTINQGFLNSKLHVFLGCYAIAIFGGRQQEFNAQCLSFSTAIENSLHVTESQTCLWFEK